MGISRICDTIQDGNPNAPLPLFFTSACYRFAPEEEAEDRFMEPQERGIARFDLMGFEDVENA